jgi:hypothetical protein
MAEYAELSTEYLSSAGVVISIIGPGDWSRMRGAYGTVGYEVTDKVMPRLTYGVTQSRSRYTGNASVALSNMLSQAGVAQDITRVRNLSRGDSLNLGVNLKLTEQAVFKVEVERTRKADCAECEFDGPILNKLPRGGEVITARSVVDFVF